jgi:peptide/nickel transport system substrate-binding protein
VASVLHIFDSDLHKSLKSQYGYGLKAVGTGRYKLASFKKGRIVLVRNEDYNVRRKPFIKRIDAKQIPDAQTQTAEFMTGNLDVLMRPTIEMIKNMGKSPNVRFTTAPGASVTYVLFDSKGRSGRKEMTDLRVRKAIAMAVDRSAMAKHLGPRKAKALDSLCLKVMKACNSSTKPPAFDVAAAKRLMAEAGYAKGFDVTLYTRPLTKDLAVNAAGYLRQIGIKAKVESIGALAAMRKIRSAGKFELFLGLWPSDSTPDASNTLNLFFRKGATDYARDPLLHKITKLGVATYDLNKRKAFYRQAYDRINNQLYWLPLISWPITWLHSKDVEYTLEGASIFLSPHLSNFKWSK